jgi:site-specific DNA-methyltransferase (adenine-specific)
MPIAKRFYASLESFPAEEIIRAAKRLMPIFFNKDYPLNNLYNVDCMDVLPCIPDNFFEIAIVDPPYGEANSGGVHRCHYLANTAKKEKRILEWDVAPPDEYWRQLWRVSKNQIVCGGNYFNLPPTKCFVFWDKYRSENFSMAMGEYIWTSFTQNAKVFKKQSNGSAKYKRFHPTQKPVELIEKLLDWFANPGDKILDTHAGSGTVAVACINKGFDWLAFEIDEIYAKLAKERIEKQKKKRIIKRTPSEQGPCFI